MPDDSERSKPTVQEIAALDVATALDLARGGLSGNERVFETHREMQPSRQEKPGSRGRSRSALVQVDGLPSYSAQRGEAPSIETEIRPPGAVPGPVARELSGARELSLGPRELRLSAGPHDREARSAAVMDREARSAAVMDREARSEIAQRGGGPSLVTQPSVRTRSDLAGSAPDTLRMPPAAMGVSMGSLTSDPGEAAGPEQRGRASTQMRTMDAGVRSIPSLGAGRQVDSRLVLLSAPDSPQAAAFRVLRYRIEQMDADALHTTVLAVCAARVGQGTTTTAANLALALAECNRARVCLMEGNLRRPALAGLFRFKPPLCLAQRLTSDRDRPLEPWSVAELTQSLHVLAVDEKAERRPLVDGPAFASGVEALRRAGYRHVVIDGPEVLGIADMNLIEEVVDGVLLVARSGVTTATELQVAAGQLASKKLRGIVLLNGE